MNRIKLLLFVVLCSSQISNAVEDCAKMSQRELDEALILAVRKGYSEETQKLVRAGANGNQKITYDAGLRDWDVDITTTLLEYAAKRGYVDIVTELKETAKNLIIAVQISIVAIFVEESSMTSSLP